MTRHLRSAMLPALALAALTLVPSLCAAEGPCCFTNPRFTGTCQVQPTGEETCAGILGYLNNPNSVGKTYCANTRVRGGWAQVECATTGKTTSVPESALEALCPATPAEEPAVAPADRRAPAG